MINRKPLKLFKSFARGRFVKPVYKDYSFANIAPTVYYLLTGEKLGKSSPGIFAKDCFGKNYPKPDKIVLFFVDSLGFLFWENYRQTIPAIEKIAKEGVVTPISALFPSTTAASVTTAAFGVLPGKHALYEWNVYIKEYGTVVQTLPFCPIDNRSLDGGSALGWDPKYLVSSGRTIGEKLARKKVTSFALIKNEYAASVYSKIASKGSKVVPFANLPEALRKIKRMLARRGKTYIYFYWDAIDSVAHRKAPGSKVHEAEIRYFWQTYEKFFADFKKGNTLFLFIADHGHHAAHFEKTLYLNKEIPEIIPYLTTYPNGSPRDVFLHIKPGGTQRALKILKNKLKDTALVLTTKDALTQGLFGPPPYSRRFIERLGQILILPYPGLYVWWYEKGKIENRFVGHHGGLSRDEMLAVLAVW